MAKKSIGLLNIVFGADLRGFDRAMKKAQKSIAKFSTKMRNVGKKLTTNVTLPIIALGVGAVKMAAQFEEVESKFNAVFKHLAKDVKDWAKITGEAIGRSQIEMLGFLSTLQDTFVPLGFSREKAAEFSKTLTTLAFDLASFNDKADAEVIKALQSAIVGNHETMRAYGVIINQAGLNQELLNMGVKDGVKNASEAQKAQARLNLIMAGTIDAQGDALKTADSLTNQLKALRAAVSNLAVEFGNILIPLAKQIVTTLREFSQSLSDLSPKTKEFIVKMAGWAAVLGPIVIFASALVSAFGKLLPLIWKIGKAVTRVLGPFGKLIRAIAIVTGGVLQMVKGERELTDLEKNLAKETKNLNKELETENDILGDILKNLDQLTPAVKQYSDALPDPIKTDFVWGMSPIDDEPEVLEWIPELTQKQKELNAATALFGDVMHQQMLHAANAQKGFFQSLFDNVKRAI